MNMPFLKQFLTLPFTERRYKITEGWDYSDDEKEIHGFSGHGAVDFALSRNTPVLAAADGWAIASYSWRRLKLNSRPLLYRGKQVGFGLGYFVQIYHPQAKLYTAYGHLCKISPGIKFHAPRKIGDCLWPLGHKLNPENLPQHKWATRVKRGQVIGYVGDSGLTWGYEDYPTRPDYAKFPSWDEVHLHFEVFIRVGSKKIKKYFDPYGIKGRESDYPDFFKKIKELGGKGTILWILGKDNRPRFTKEAA